MNAHCNLSLVNSHEAWNCFVEKLFWVVSNNVTEMTPRPRRLRASSDHDGHRDNDHEGHNVIANTVGKPTMDREGHVQSDTTTK